MRRLDSEFIPTLAPSTDPSFMGSEAGRWFLQVADSHKEPNGHLQGMYIVNSEGFGPRRGFDGIGTYPPPKVLHHIDEELKKVPSQPTRRTILPQPADAQPAIV